MDERSAPSALPGQLLAALNEWMAWADPAPDPDDSLPALDEAWTSAGRQFLYLMVVVMILLLMPLLLEGWFPF